MRAWVCERFVEPVEFSMQEVPEPQPGPGQVQVAVRAAGLPFGEKYVMNGSYQVKPPLPYVIGHEIAGDVMAVGEGVTRFKAGDRVLGMNWSLTGGALGEVMVLIEADVKPLPATISYEQGAAFTGNYYTAYVALLRRGQWKPGETIVVHGSSGALGIAAVQIARHLGAFVIGVGGNDEKLKAVKGFGADEVINYNTTDVREAIKELTGGKGADLHFDGVGGDSFDVAMRTIAPGGRIVVLGAASGRWGTPKTNIMLVKNIAVVGAEAAVYRRTSGAQGPQDMDDLLDIVAKGHVIPWVDKAYPFEDAREAFAHIWSRQGMGKTVVVSPPR